MPVSKAKTLDKEIRATCKILESVAKSYPRGSPEREAIREAADAFIHLRLQQGLQSSYYAFRKVSTKPLTRSQRRTLRKMGVSV